MTPFYHPTSILVLDDDPLFLESLDFQFSDELSCQTFTRPDAALEHLRAQARQHPDFSRYFKDCSEMDLGSESRHGDRLLRLQLSELRSMVDDHSRHQRVSVAVVDYDMPKMTGVQFCRAIRDLPVKTILLTGKAGLETAISAFNEGVIDCFLQKQDANVSIALRREIKRLQGEYFEEISDPIQCALALQKPSFFSDPEFIRLFNEVSEENGVVEHYVCACPPGVMMRDAEANESFLLVCDIDVAKSQCEVAEDRRAPSDMLQLLRTRKAQAWFPTQEGFYHPDFEAEWARYIWPAQLLPGSGSWSYSYIQHECPVEEALQQHGQQSA
jgi:CheY-like chemotaxis protein